MNLLYLVIVPNPEVEEYLGDRGLCVIGLQVDFIVYPIPVQILLELQIESNDTLSNYGNSQEKPLVAGNPRVKEQTG